MPDLDGYESYYANRIWQMLPGVYRALDGADPTVTGPLQELVARVGSQVAVVRRSIDRLWADQSIETCDDWVIPYIGELLGTKLVDDDARGQRLQVAKTIHYRRRKGTVAVLEEIARDVTGCQAHVVESFRRLSRTRHSLDPPVGPGPLSAALPTPCATSSAAGGQADPSQLLEHEGLVGPITGTPAGGFADLRSSHGATLTESPFDEYFHTADVRTGQGSVGRYGIPKLLVFLWRLISFAIAGATPVPVQNQPNEYVFDPTGRQIPLFLAPLGPEPDDWVDTWTSAAEWQVPGPLTDSLQRAIADSGAGPPAHAPYPDVADVPALYAVTGAASLEPVDADISPESGTLTLTAPITESVTVSYQYGFPAMIGAGPYDRTLLGDPPTVVGSEATVRGGTGLGAAVSAAATQGTITIADSLTYGAVGDAGSSAAPIESLLVRAGAQVRPVIRLPAPAQPSDPPDAWVFTGGGPTSELVLDGLFVSGGDIVLRGGFATVRLTGCTMDPGTRAAAGGGYAQSADGRSLAPTRVWIEADPSAAAGAPATIASLTIDHCVLGPIRTRNGGVVEQTTVSDSIVQGIDPGVAAPPTVGEVYDPELLVRSLKGGGAEAAAVTDALQNGNQTAAVQAIGSYQSGPVDPGSLAAVVSGLNAILGPAVSLAMLRATYPVALSPAAVALSSGVLTLERVSILGHAFAHRLWASDAILAGVTMVEDDQNGCVRFSAFSSDSHVPTQYRSASITGGSALFTSTSFGDPGYGQLLETADAAIAASAGQGAASAPTITTGAESGSEMGAYSSLLLPIKLQGLLTKYGEYMPLGLTPVVVNVT